MAHATTRAFADERRAAIMEMLEHNASVQVADLVTTPSFHWWSSVTGSSLTSWVSPQRWQTFSTLPASLQVAGVVTSL